MMPCAWGVYRGDDGRVYVSGMNMGLMGQLFGGTIADVMGDTVAKQEEAMLEEALESDATGNSSPGSSANDPLDAGRPAGDGATDAVPESAAPEPEHRSQIERE
jgi:hypothetical protein